MIALRKGNATELLTLCDGNPSITGEFPSQRASDVKRLCFYVLIAWTNCSRNNWVTWDAITLMWRHKWTYLLVSFKRWRIKHQVNLFFRFVIMECQAVYVGRDLIVQLIPEVSQSSTFINSLWPGDSIKRHRSGSARCNGLSPDGTNTLPEPLLINYQWGLVTFTSDQVHRKCSRYLSLICVWK